MVLKKRNLAQSPRKYAILTLRSKNFSGQGQCPLPRPLLSGEEDTPSPYLPPWRLRRLELACAIGARPCPPTSTPGSAYGSMHCYWQTGRARHSRLRL